MKARVALEALEGVKKVQQIAAECQIHVVQGVGLEKALLEERAESAGPRDRVEAATSEGELTLDVDFLKKGESSSGLLADLVDRADADLRVRKAMCPARNDAFPICITSRREIGG